MSDMMRCVICRMAISVFLCLAGSSVWSQSGRVVDLPTRPGVTQRVLVHAPSAPKAVAVLFAGGHGGLQISGDGQYGWGAGNFLIRSRDLFVRQGFVTVEIDAPSDRMGNGFLSGFRQTPEHRADIGELMKWLRAQHPGLAVWLVGTSRGTQSVAYLATELEASQMPDGIVLTSSILSDPHGRAVPKMPLEKLRIPVLVAHHQQDGCRLCLMRDMPALMEKLGPVPSKELLSFTGGLDRGDPCEARAYHGFNGIESEVVEKMALWMFSVTRSVKP